MRTKASKKHKTLVVIIGIVLAIVLSTLGFLFWKNYVVLKDVTLPQNISTFEQCKQATGSILLETSPEQCRTIGGKTFTDSVTKQAEEVLKSYCAEGERLCFNYPMNWSVSKLDQSSDEHQAGFTGGMLSIKDSSSGLSLRLKSGIGGVGGACDDESKTPVYVLDSTEIPKLTGFKSAYSLDTLRVARVIYPWNGTDSYVAGLYVTGDADYTSKQTINRCGIFMSSIIVGRNAKIDSESPNPGAFEFKLENNADENRYSSIKAATEAYNSTPYKEATAILVSLRYE